MLDYRLLCASTASKSRFDVRFFCPRAQKNPFSVFASRISQPARFRRDPLAVRIRTVDQQSWFTFAQESHA